TLTQLRRIGATDKHLHVWKRDALIARVEREVYSLAGGQLTWPARFLSLCFASGGLASHRSAALDQLEAADQVHPSSRAPTAERFGVPECASTRAATSI